jgi:hypothetical protein
MITWRSITIPKLQPQQQQQADAAGLQGAVVPDPVRNLQLSSGAAAGVLAGMGGAAGAAQKPAVTAVAAGVGTQQLQPHLQQQVAANVAPFVAALGSAAAAAAGSGGQAAAVQRPQGKVLVFSDDEDDSSDSD